MIDDDDPGYRREVERTRRTRERFEAEDPQRKALECLVNSDLSDRVERQQLYATRAAAWASLAVLHKLEER